MKFQDVAHHYLGVECLTPEGKDTLEGVYRNATPVFYNTVKDIQWPDIKPILKPTSEISQEDFKDFATSELLTKNEKMAFDFSDNDNWRACSYEHDPDDIEWDDAQRINDCEENDPFGVLMMNTKRGDITHGWIELDETYCPVNVSVTARWIAFLCSKGYDVFGLIESGEAITNPKN